MPVSGGFFGATEPHESRHEIPPAAKCERNSGSSGPFYKYLLEKSTKLRRHIVGILSANKNDVKI